MQPDPPIFFWDPQGLAVFYRLEELEAYLDRAAEPLSELARAYDSQGRRLRLSKRTRALRFGFHRVDVETGRIALADILPEHPEELREILRAHLAARIPDGTDLANATLEELVRLAAHQGSGGSVESSRWWPWRRPCGS